MGHYVSTILGNFLNHFWRHKGHGKCQYNDTAKLYSMIGHMFDFTVSKFSRYYPRNFYFSEAKIFKKNLREIPSSKKANGFD